MKKLIFVLLLVFLLLFNGCSDSSSEFTLEDFESEINLLCFGTNIKGIFTYNSGCNMSVEFSAPEDIKGVRAQYDGVNVTFHYGEVASDIGVNKEYSCMQILFEGINKLSECERLSEQLFECEYGTFTFNTNEGFLLPETFSGKTFECKFNY